MLVNYSDSDVLKAEKSIFLAGPTPRDKHIETWRKEAIEILESLDFNGIVYVPEDEIDERRKDYVDQADWEREALYNSTVIVFWVPRSQPDMPAFTTNVEFGYWIAKDSTKVIYGRPNNAEKIKYLDWLYITKTGELPSNNLSELLEKAVAKTYESEKEEEWKYQKGM